MRNRFELTLRALAAWLLLAAAQTMAAQPSTITVHADRPGVKMSPLLYGIFFEEINRAGDGGIYAEMIQNRSFEDDRGNNDTRPIKTPAWTLVKGDGAKATMALDDSKPLNAKNPKLVATGDCGGRPPRGRGQRRFQGNCPCKRTPNTSCRTTHVAARTSAGPLRRAWKTRRERWLPRRRSTVSARTGRSSRQP